VTLQDLELSLEDFLRSKKQATPSAASARGLPLPVPAPAPMASASATATSTAPALEARPISAMASEVEERIDGAEGGPAGNAFPPEFLSRLQRALDARRILSEADLEQLLEGPIPTDLMAELGEFADIMPKWEADWREKQKERQRLEMLAKQKQQRPVWRCAACGRYGCPVAPYIERMEEFEV
jgi:rubrerythrin